MTDKIRDRIHKKYISDEVMLVDYHDGLWEVVLEARNNRLLLGHSEEEFRKWAGKNHDLLKEFDEILTYFLTDMNSQFRHIVAKARQDNKGVIIMGKKKGGKKGC